MEYDVCCSDEISISLYPNLRRNCKISHPEHPKVFFCCCFLSFPEKEREQNLLNIKVQYTPVTGKRYWERTAMQYGFFLCICMRNTFMMWPESHIFTFTLRYTLTNDSLSNFPSDILKIFFSRKNSTYT